VQLAGVAGGVNRAAAVPVEAIEPQPAGETLQVTAASLVLLTVALNSAVCAVVMDRGFVPSMVIATSAGGGAGVTVTVAEAARVPSCTLVAVRVQVAAADGAR
jgi:hypothetical protein